MIYVLLDPGSNETFIKSQNIKKLGIEGVKTHLQQSTIHGTEVITTHIVTGLKLEDSERTSHLKVYCKDDIRSKKKDVL